MAREYLDIAIALASFAGLVLATILLVYLFSLPRLAAGLRWISWAWRRVAAGTASAFDRLIPIAPRNGTASTTHFALWASANVAAVLAFCVTQWLATSLLAINIMAGVCAFLAVANILFLSGAYWALREGEAVMNDEENYLGSLFDDLSTAKNVSIFITAAVVTILQIAVIIAWAQEQAGVVLVIFERRIGFSYLDYLVFVLDAVPFASLYTQAAGLSEFSSPALGAGAWTSVAINSVASLLIVGGAVAFLQRNADLEGMIERLVERNDTSGGSVLGGRFIRAPAIVKAYVRTAFREESDDERKLRYMRLALLKPSYGFPASFIRDYRNLSERVREEGAQLVEDFLDKEKLNDETLADLLKAVQQSRDHVAIKNAKSRDRLALGRILAATLHKRLRTALATKSPNDADRIREQVEIKLVTLALREVLKKADPSSAGYGRAKELLAHANLLAPNKRAG